MADLSPSAAVLNAIRSGGDRETLPVSICRACVGSMPIDGAALSLIDHNFHPERVASSDRATERVEEVQVTVGEGPVFQAFALGAPVLIAEMDSGISERWPAFAEAIALTEMSAVFVFPLQIGAIRLGALSLYRRTPGSLAPDDLSEALRVADVVSMLFLGSGGDLAEDFAEQWLDESSWTGEVHQATGMLIAQLGVDAEEAFVRLRAFAFARNVPLSEVARAVVSHQLRLSDMD